MARHISGLKKEVHHSFTTWRSSSLKRRHTQTHTVKAKRAERIQEETSKWSPHSHSDILTETASAFHFRWWIYTVLVHSKRKGKYSSQFPRIPACGAVKGHAAHIPLVHVTEHKIRVDNTATVVKGFPCESATLAQSMLEKINRCGFPLSTR